MSVLTLIDLTGIQRFVFASNRLRDVVGGSMLVEDATATKGWLTRLGAADRVIVAAGGNAVLHFEEIEQARSLAARLSRRLTDEAPGLEAVIAHQEVGEKGLARALLELQVRVAAQKLKQQTAPLQLSLGVTERCRATGQVASSIDHGQPVSAGVIARRQRLRDQGDRTDEWFKSWSRDSNLKPVFPIENDELGRSAGEKSQIAVVHVDGNAVGKKLAAWLQAQAEADLADEALVQGLKTISLQLDQLARGAFDDVLARVEAVLEVDETRRRAWLKGHTLGRSLELSVKQNRVCLPLRPILIGGDDLTFLCDGRIALDLAAAALVRFKTAGLSRLGQIGACAGVSIVHAHAPFSRAARAAEALCAHAKAALRQQGKEEGCAIDWHIGPLSPQEPVAEMRARTYRTRDWCLTCRPYLFGSNGGVGMRSFEWLEQEVLGTSGKGLRGPVWRAHRSKVKEMPVLARQGPEYLEMAVTAWQAADPGLERPPGLGDPQLATPLLDAVELMDLHYPLDMTQSEEAPR